VARLRDEFVAGRLSQETFLHRMHMVLETKQQADLPPLLADLPAPPGEPQSQQAQQNPAQQDPAQQDPAQQDPAPPGEPGQVQPQHHQQPHLQLAQPYPADQPPSRPLASWLRNAWSWLSGSAGATGPGYPRRRGRPGQSGRPGHEHWTGPRTVSPQPARGHATGLRAAGGMSPPLSLQFPRGGGDQFSIGRDASCDLAIADMTVSRRHATLERTADGWLISDLASTNGTRVNGWRVRGKVPVRVGDLVSFGNLETVFARGDD
jgi:hypothetical protein